MPITVSYCSAFLMCPFLIGGGGKDLNNQIMSPLVGCLNQLYRFIIITNRQILFRYLFIELFISPVSFCFSDVNVTLFCSAPERQTHKT